MLRVLPLAILVACYSPAYQDCAISCAVNGVCPSGLDCVAGVCRSMTGACGGGNDGSIGDGQAFGDWQFRKLVTYTRGPTETLTNFPVLVQRLTDPDLKNFAQNDGGDIRFATAAGVPLAHEIERFDAATGELVAWVNVPALAAAVPTSFYMYFGNPTVADQETPLAVWDTDYIGVWHLSDPPGQAVNDSSPNGAEGTKGSANTPAPIAAGKLGGSFLFAGAASELISIGNDVAKVSATSYTFETWLNRNVQPVDTYRRLIDFPTAFVPHPAIAYPDAGAPNVNPQSLVVQFGQATLQTPPSSVPASTWVHIAVVVDGTTAVSIYLNGQIQSVTPAPFALAQDNTTVTIGGRSSPSSSSVDGLMDEVRLSRIARTPGYIAASYVSQSESSAVTFGPAETAP